MKRIYQNFDGLDVSFQCAIPEEVRAALREAKLDAQKRKGDVLIHLGPDAIPVMVAETGMRGGYAFRFDTGPDGEIWAVGDSETPQGWHVRVSVKSLALALHGYDEVARRLWETLDSLGAYGERRLDPVTGEMTEAIKERVSRFDFCIDYTTDDFEPDPEMFVAHSRCTRRTHAKTAGLPVEQIGRGRFLESVRIGEMPNRQVTMYDKTREIRSSAKQFWWDIWGLDKETFEGRIWRIEARAGKEELNKWNLRTFADFERMAGNVIVSILEAIRYVEPNRHDTNRTRWPMAPLWEDAVTAAGDALAPYTSKAERKKIIADIRSNIIGRYDSLMPGLIIGYTAAMGLDVSEIPETLEKVSNDVLAVVNYDPAAALKKYLKAEERFVFLQDTASQPPWDTSGSDAA